MPGWDCVLVSAGTELLTGVKPRQTALKIALFLPLNKQLEEGEIVQGASGSAAPSGMGFLMA